MSIKPSKVGTVEAGNVFVQRTHWACAKGSTIAFVLLSRAINVVLFDRNLSNSDITKIMSYEPLGFAVVNGSYDAFFQNFNDAQIATEASY